MKLLRFFLFILTIAISAQRQAASAQGYRAFRSNGALGIAADNVLQISRENQSLSTTVILIGTEDEWKNRKTLAISINDSVAVNAPYIIPDSLLWTCLEFEDGTRLYTKGKNSIQQNKSAVVSLWLHSLMNREGTTIDISVAEKIFSTSNIKTIYMYGGSKSNQLTWSISPSSSDIYRQLVRRFDLWGKDI